MFILYPSIGSKIFRIFQCIDVGDKKQYLKADMTIQCNTGNHLTWVNIAMVFVFLYVIGIPLYSFYMLWTNKKHLHDVKSKKHVIVRNELGSLYMQYEKPYWYWELIEMLRKIILTGAIIVVGNGDSFQIFVALLVQFFYILLMDRLVPYELDRDDVVQFIASSQLFLTLLVGLVIKLRVNNTKEPLQANADENHAYGVALIVLNMSVIVTAVMSLILATPCGEKCINMCIKKKDTKKIDPTKISPIISKSESSMKVSSSEKANKFWTEKASEKSMKEEEKGK